MIRVSGGRISGAAMFSRDMLVYGICDIYRIESSSASDVDLLDMNPYSLSVSGLCLSVHFSSRFLNSFSRIFEN